MAESEGDDPERGRWPGDVEALAKELKLRLDFR
jgi:hypothetical protein